jgi:hypothetical protein
VSAIGGDDHAPSGPGADIPIAPLCDILLASLKAMADCGQTEAACRLAGRACVLLRHPRPDIARRFDVLLHRLTPKLIWDKPPPRA